MMRSVIGGVLVCLAALSAGPLAAQGTRPGGQAGGPMVRRSWTADARTLAVGEVFTVIVDDRTSASQRAGTSASSSRSSRGDFAATQNVVPATPTTPAAPAFGYGTSAEGASERKGEQVRENRFRGEIAVKVVSVEPGGMVRIEGAKTVNVDRSSQIVLLSGLVRPDDVTAGNLIESWRVADLNLQYRSKGSLGKPRSGIVSRILGWFWP